MFVERTIDYIQYSVTHLQDFDLKDNPTNSPLKFYTTMFVGNHGIQVHGGNPNSDKWLVVASGQACDALRSAGKWESFLNNAWSLDAKFTRVDWCITQFIDHDGLVTRDDIAQAVRENKVISAWAKSGSKSIYNEIEQHRETTYIGDMKKRSKRGIFRAYDKGFELDLDKYLISRFEAEERQDNAHTSMKRHIEQGWDIGQVVRSRIDILEDYWQELTSSEIPDMTRGQGLQKDDTTQSDRWKWLIEQVAPSLGKTLALDHESGIGNANFNIFMDKMIAEYNKAAAGNDKD